MRDGPKKKKGLWKILCIVVLLMTAVVVAAPFLIDVNQFRPELESKLAAALGTDVKVGHLQCSLWSGSVTADEIVIAADPKFGPAPLVKAERLQVGVELKPLIFSKTLRITAITLDQPEITLIRSQSGEWNFSSFAGRSQASRTAEAGYEPSVANFSIASLKVSGGRVTVIRSGIRLKPHVYDHVDITARYLSFTSVFPFSMTAALPGGGSASLKGRAGPVNKRDVALTPFESAIAIHRFDLISSGFIEPDLGLGAVIDFDANITSDRGRIHTRGRANVEKLQLVKSGSPAPRPVALTYSFAYDLVSQVGTIEEATMACEKAVLHFGGSYEKNSDPMTVKIKLHGDRMPVSDLESLLPAFGVSLPKGASLQGGTLSTDLAAEGPIDKMTTSGTVELVGTRLAGFDLGSNIAKVASLAGINPDPNTDIEKLTSMIWIRPEGNQIKNLDLVVPSLGELNGDGVIRPDQSLDFKMAARLKKAEGLAGGLLHIAGNNGLVIPFFIRGTATEPRFSPDMKGAAGSLLDSAKDKGSGAAGNALDALRDLLGKKKK